MIYDLHTHHHPILPGEAVVQLSPDAFVPQPGHLYSVGLHPWDVGGDWRVLMASLLVMALHPQVVMVGETGVDKIKGTAGIELQVEVFREHVKLSELVCKPLIVHCVKAIDEILAVRKELRAQMPWVIHGFRGGVEQAKQLVRAGIFMSVGGRFDEELLRALPLDSILVESDELSDVGVVYERVGAIKGVEVAELKQHVANNIYDFLASYRTE